MAKIFCFSSTGNSLYVAKCLAEGIGADVLPMNRAEQLCDDDVIGFVFPAYFWGLPKLVNDFVSTLKITNKQAYFFTVITYGGMIYGVEGKIDMLLKQKGAKLCYGNKIKSVENYILYYKTNSKEKLHKRVDKYIDDILPDIKNRLHSKVQKYSFINRFMYKFYPGLHGDCDKGFTVSNKCTGCGICQKVCPVNNIVVKDTQPKYQHKCEHCLACIHACTTQALDWKRSIKDRKRYLNPYIDIKELISFNRVE